MTTDTSLPTAHPGAPGWGRGAMQGAFMLSWSTMFIHALSIARTAILARWLLPELFGLVALAEAMLTTLRQVQDFNFDTGLLYRRTRLPQTIAANLALKTLFSGLTFALIWLGHGWLSRWYDPRVGMALLWFAAGSIAQTLGSTPRVLLEREFRFADMVAVQVTSAVIRTIVPVTMALAGLGLWSLVAEAVIDMALPAIGFWWRRPIRWEAWPSREDFRWFFQFSWPLWMAGGLSVICYAGSHVVVGSLFGNTTLGWYALAFTFAGLPVQFVTHAISRATFPAYAALQARPATVAKLYQLVLRVVCWLIFPIATLAALLAPEAVHWVLGAPWLGAVPLFQSLCVFTALRSLHDHALVVLNAHGRTTWSRNVMGWEALVLVGLGAWLVTSYGALGMTWALNGMLAVGVACAFGYVRRLAPVALWPVVRVPALICALMAGACVLLQVRVRLWPLQHQFAAKGLVGLCIGGWAAWAWGRPHLQALRQGLRSLWRGEWAVSDSA